MCKAEYQPSEMSRRVNSASQVDLLGASQKDRSKNDHKVTFCRVHVREYERILGDHPGAATGPPIGIGWKYLKGRSYQVDYYENVKYERKRLRERRDSMERMLPDEAVPGGESIRCQKKCLAYEPLPGFVRRNMLKFDLEYTEAEIEAAVMGCIEIRKQRYQSANSFRKPMVLSESSSTTKERIVASAKSKFRGAVRAVMLSLSTTAELARTQQ